MRYEQLKFKPKKKVYAVVLGDLDEVKICSVFFSKRRAIWEAKNLALKHGCLRTDKTEWMNEGGEVTIIIDEQPVY